MRCVNHLRSCVFFLCFRKTSGTRTNTVRTADGGEAIRDTCACVAKGDDKTSRHRQVFAVGPCVPSASHGVGSDPARSKLGPPLLPLRTTKCCAITAGANRNRQMPSPIMVRKFACGYYHSGSHNRQSRPARAPHSLSRTPASKLNRSRAQTRSHAVSGVSAIWGCAWVRRRAGLRAARLSRAEASRTALWR